MTSHQRIVGKLTGFIRERLLDGEASEDQDPLTADTVDSLGLEQLVDYIELEFGVSIADEEMVRKNFSSISVLASFIESKKKTLT